MTALPNGDLTRLESLGVVHPERSRPTEELIAEMPNPPAFDMVDLTGVERRRWRADGEDSLSLATDAANKCLSASQYEAADLDVIISASITRFNGEGRFQYEPCLARSIKDEIGCRPDAIDFDVGNACAGMLTAMWTLDSMIQSGAVRRGMVVSGECITPITDSAILEISDPIDDQFASLTVGDSGTAIILDRSPEPGIARISAMDFVSVGKSAELCLGMPSDRGEGVVMYTKAIELHKAAINRIPKLVKQHLADRGVAQIDFEYAIPHQTSSRAIATAMELCEPLFSPFPEVCTSIDEFGNTSSTSHWVVLDQYRQKGRFEPGEKVLLMALASGLVLGCVTMTFEEKVLV